MNLKKNEYHRPVLDTVHIDNSISLIMSTTFPEDEEDPFNPSAQATSKPVFMANEPPSLSSNPLGGSSPNYE